MPKLPVVRNGPPATFVVFPSRKRKISLPTDQIIDAEDTGGYARVDFGGMKYVGIEGEKFVFDRVRDLAPPETLAPDRGMRMAIEMRAVSKIVSEGDCVWPLG